MEHASENERANLEARLRGSVENWYAWLTSKPDVLFYAEDVQTMQRPVAYFHQANEWLSRTTMLNADWFFQQGSDIVMSRWKKGEYDAYDT
ncbi:hypothetical protein [Alicyclobacillus sp. ALC3]|uniref:hypothetical protein n=1 Tax=Alicyclobacillus sp. ALC3 TaxID=2796143 RepID=UPI0023794287|nr:hypothetical protein [Alicyclobacillus sp. ALC3]WDL95144.1 hypothetical protein JC200_11980 [Alicyclobacillus sp. ALC3]